MQKGLPLLSILAEGGQIIIWIIVGALVIAIAGGAYYLGRSTSPKSSTNPAVTSQTPQPITSPSSSGEFKQIIISNKWARYQPACKLLVSNIEIYYPDNWLPKEFEDTRGEEIVACYVVFGYPVQPQSFQAPTPNQLATFTINAFKVKDETFSQYIDIIKKQDPVPIKVSKVVFNNQEYTQFDFEKKCCADASVFYTSKGQIFFRIQTINSRGYSGENLDQLYNLDPTTINSLNNEFLKRIKFL